MIHSMTGFARSLHNTKWGHVGWEMRSVNHRYLDLHFHLPEQWRELEADLRKELQRVLQRGKVDIYLNYVNHSIYSDIHLNTPVVNALVGTYNQLKQQISHLRDIDMVDLLRWPGAIKTEQTVDPEIKALILRSFQETLTILVEQRQREGALLVDIVLKKLQEILDRLAVVIPRREQLLQEQRQKFYQRIEALQHAFDPNRLEQELLIWAQKSDITEEIDRLQAHVQEAQKILQKKPTAVGRQLEFLVQELLREANTLTSKSNDTLLTTVAVDIKVYIEQIREQLQNIA